jgi:uncharacterized protein (DUF2141 family)
MQNKKVYGLILVGLTLALTMFTLSARVKAVTLVGDLNDDGKVDVKDIYLAAKAFGSTTGESRWNADADMNLDGEIDLMDIFVIASHFG